MNKLYFNDKTENIETSKPNNGYTKIETNKSYDEFISEYEKCREQGESIIDSIEWAK